MKRALVLDGGGGKAIYTLGLLYELEQCLRHELNIQCLAEVFDCFFGTSSGGIISAGIAHRLPVEKIYLFYLTTLQHIMYRSTIGRVTPGFFAKERSTRLREALSDVFGTMLFSEIKHTITLYATDFEKKVPRIFYTDQKIANVPEEDFTPGFGASMVDALLATSAAFPVFDPVFVKGTEIQFTAVDGAYYANCPILLAASALKTCYSTTPIRILNVGVGTYYATHIDSLLKKMDAYTLLTLFSDTGTNVHLELTHKLCSGTTIQYLRINDFIPLKVDFFLQEKETIELVFTHGRKSFQKHKEAIMYLLGIWKISV